MRRFDTARSSSCGIASIIVLYLLAALSCRQMLCTLAASTENSTRIETETFTPPIKNLKRENPCFDRSTNCPAWTDASECRKKGARRYMRDNCPYSCNLCNPILEPWQPRSSHYLCKRTYASQEEMDVKVFTGVSQTLEFMDSPILNRDEDRAMPKVKRLQNEEDFLYLQSRIQDVLTSQQNYLDDFYGDVDYSVLGDGTKARSSIDPDFDDIPVGTLLPLVESCINRHPYCANWAVKGLCELKPSLMQESCSPVCGNCKMNEVEDSAMTLYDNDGEFPSPFRRKDLFGIMDAIHEERVVVDWYTHASDLEAASKANIQFVRREIDGEVRTRMYTEDIKKSMYIWNRGPIHVDFLKDKVPTNETGTLLQQIMILDNFTSPEACKAVLDAVKFGVGLDTASARTKRGDDGFPEATKESKFELYADGKPNEVEKNSARSSSQIFLFPTLKQEDRMVFAPSIERLLLKISLLTSIPLDHVEFPIRIEKFQPGEFRREVSHFRDAIQTMESTRYFKPSNLNEGDEYKGASKMHYTSKMQNARVFGLTLFLNDVEEGGSLYFPNMSQNIRISPKIGRAVLFPTVVSLNGNWDYDVGAQDPLDEEYEHVDSDESFLIEDMTTMCGHKKVLSGTKYSITIYFRRYPNGGLKQN